MEFKYWAQHTETGKRVSAVMEADDPSIVVARLKQEGLMPIRVSRARSFNLAARQTFSLQQRRITGKDLAVFTRQLAATLQAGLLLTEALETIAEDMDNAGLRRILDQVREHIRSGSDFSSALSRFPAVFSKTYIAIIKSGEVSGTLHRTVKELARYLENNERTKEKVKTAIRYPLFILSFAVFVLLVMVLFLIPKFSAMFLSSGAQLPFLTRLVVGVSEFVLHHTLALFLGLAAFILLTWVGLKNERLRRRWDEAKLRLPLIGKPILHKAIVSRFCRTLAVLLRGGVGLSQALQIAAETVDHLPFADIVENIRTRVVAGGAVSEEMKKSVLFPRLTVKMVHVGEKTGRLDEMLLQCADYYDEEIETSLQNLTALLEPALIIFIGGIVLIVVLALYLPIFQLSQTIR